MKGKEKLDGNSTINTDLDSQTRENIQDETLSNPITKEEVDALNEELMYDWASCFEVCRDGCMEQQIKCVVAGAYHEFLSISELCASFDEDKFWKMYTKVMNDLWGDEYEVTETYNTLTIIPITKSIGDLLSEHANEDGIAYLTHYSQDYLTKKEEDMFVKLCKCTDGSHLTGEFDDNGDVNVYGNESAYYASYGYNYPAADVYREMLWKMRAEVNDYMVGLKTNPHSDFRIWKSDDYLGYMTLDIFADDFEVEINNGFDYCKGWYIDVAGNE